MLLRRARFLAADKAGRSSAASAAMMTITTSSSINVNARRRILILHLVVCFHRSYEHGGCQAVLRAKRLIFATPGMEGRVNFTQNA
jgi:hypothetical protein